MPRLRDGREPRITSGFGPRTGGLYDFHYGSDFFYPRKNEAIGPPTATANGKWGVPFGVPALSAADGIVTKSSWINTGDRVRIDHGDGLATGYMHLRKRRVKVGDFVKAGHPIGEVSFSPWKGGAPSSPPPSPPNRIGLNHLHFEVYRNGTQVDPERFLRNAAIIDNPLGYGWIIAGGIAIAAGLFAARYVR